MKIFKIIFFTIFAISAFFIGLVFCDDYRTYAPKDPNDPMLIRNCQNVNPNAYQDAYQERVLRNMAIVNQMQQVNQMPNTWDQYYNVNRCSPQVSEPVLRYNPYNNQWTYEDRNAQLRYNPMNNNWQYK